MISFRKDIALFNKDYLPPKRAGDLTANIMHNDDILNKKRRLTFTLSLSTAVDVPGRTEQRGGLETQKTNRSRFSQVTGLYTYTPEKESIDNLLKLMREFIR